MPTIQRVDDFVTQNWSTSSGTPLRVATPLHAQEKSSLEISTSAALEYVIYSAFGGTPTMVVCGFWFYLNALPAANTMIAKIDMGPVEGRIRTNPSGQLYIAGDGTPTMASAFLANNLSIQTWYWIELLVDKSANPWVLKANRDGNIASTSGAVAASNCGADFVMLGTNGAETLTAYYSYLEYGTANNNTDWLGAPSRPLMLPADHPEYYAAKVI